MVERDLLQEIARVSCARRAALIHAHRHRLSREDLEDCYSQATLELLLGAQRGRAFSGARHVANALELRFVSRIRDLRRAVSGRSASQTVMATSVRLGSCGQTEPADPRLDVERLVDARLVLERLGEAASSLTSDQWLVLHSQLVGLTASELCVREGWSREKYRKVAQRARARLQTLVERPAAVRAEGRPERRDPRRVSRLHTTSVPFVGGPSDQRAGTL